MHIKVAIADIIQNAKCAVREGSTEPEYQNSIQQHRCGKVKNMRRHCQAKSYTVH
jgi:hypothetical protein